MKPWSFAHAAAIAAGESRYRDPTTGYWVFTEHGLRARGKCCGCGCRHCPWPAVGAYPIAPMLRGEVPDGPVTVLFWSGGKDSFLALRALQRESAQPVLLLTTYGASSRTVAHQELPIATIRGQAEALGLPLLEVPLVGDDYLEAVASALHQLAGTRSIAALAFGDLHLTLVREWRERNLGPVAKALGARLSYPLWLTPYDALLADLEASGVAVQVCAVPEPIDGVAVGDAFDAALVASLPEGVDAFGENGEFHSVVVFSDLADAASA